MNLLFKPNCSPFVSNCDLFLYNYCSYCVVDKMVKGDFSTAVIDIAYCGHQIDS